MKLEVNKLALKFGDNLIFKNLSLSLSEGEILALRGANGCGKSSLCLCLTGLLDAGADGVKYKGEITFDGKKMQDMSIAERCGYVGMIFQNPDNQLFSPLVTEELSFAPENLAVPREEIQRRVDNALKLCNIEYLRNAKTTALSGGEKQLVAIAAVLTMQPKILIADEITSNIDMERKETVRGILTDYAKNGGSVIMVSHNEKDMAIANRIITMERGKDYAD